MMVMGDQYVMFCFNLLVGEEMCYQLSKLGAKVILSSRNEKKLDEVKSKLANPDNAM